MTKATSLAAAIESALDIEVALVEGHNGIYEVSVDDEVVYTNDGQCSDDFPSDEQLVERVSKTIGVTPKPPASSAFPIIQNEGPCCSLPAQNPVAGMEKFVPLTGSSATTSGCGCTPANAGTSTSSEGCCEPPKKKKWIKTTIFTVVMLAAVGVGATSLLRQSSATAQVDPPIGADDQSSPAEPAEPFRAAVDPTQPAGEPSCCGGGQPDPAVSGQPECGSPQAEITAETGSSCCGKPSVAPSNTASSCGQRAKPSCCGGEAR